MVDVTITRRIVEVNGRGARGESYADILRRTGLFGVLPTDDDATAIGKLNADAAESAAFAEEFSGPAYASQAAGEAATTEGQFFRVPIADTDPVEYTRYQRTAGGSVEAAPLATTASLASTDPGKGAALVGLPFQTVSAALKRIDLAQLGVNPDTAVADRAAAFQAAIDSASANGGGTLTLNGLFDTGETSLGIEGDIYLKPNVSIEAGAQPLVINNGGFRVDGSENGAHVPNWTVELNVTRTGSEGPAIFLGGDDSAAPDNKAAIRGRLMCRILGSTGAGLQISNGYLLDIVNPQIAGCADAAIDFAYGPEETTSANAVNIWGGELHGCGLGYRAVGVSGVYFYGVAIEGNAGAALIGANCRSLGHYGGYFEQNGTGSDYDIIVGDSGTSPVNIFFDGVDFYDGSGGGKAYALKLVKVTNMVVARCRYIGYDTALADFQPASGGAVKGGWLSLYGGAVPVLSGTPNAYFRPLSDIDRKKRANVVVSPGTVAANSSVVLSVAVSDAVAGSKCEFATAQSLGDCFAAMPVCTTAGTVTLRIVNPTAADVTIPDFTARVWVEDYHYW